MEQVNDIIGKEFLQSCGDSLLVVEKTNQRNKGGSGNILYKCQFIEYPFICFKTKCEILNGSVGNPELEKNKIVGQSFKQNCGDILKVLRRTEERRKIRKDNQKLGEYYWECEFQKYPYKIIVTKGEIINGTVLNPLVEQKEFVEKIWPQNCGDSLRIIKKSENKRNDVWDCEFTNHPYQISAYKGNIIAGKCLNPQIEIDNYTNKIIKQNCGDSVILLKKEGKLWEGQFINYPCIVKKPLYYFIAGEVLNHNLPWRCKSSLLKYIRETFFDKKPTLFELATSLNKSLGLICKKINEFGLKEYIEYSFKGEENQILEFLKSIYNGEVIKYSGKKEDNYYEIDIYLPKLKKGIEYNGSIWHEEGNLNNPYSKQINYHKEKQEFFAKKGIEILFIWDYEWFEDFPKRQIINEKIKQKIREFLEI